MKSDKIFDMIGKADDKYVAEAKRTRKKPKLWLIPAAAALLVCTLTLGAFIAPLFLRGELPIPSPDDHAYGKYRVLAAKYPEMVRYPSDPDDYESYRAWNLSRNELNVPFMQLESTPDEFIKNTVREFLINTENKNPVYSPINVYMALAMLAETADGESRAQLLRLLGADSIEELRANAAAIFSANYSDDGALTNIVSSSIWLADNLNYNEKTLQTLANDYFASSFSGEMGSENYNEALRTWLNDNTGGLLSDSIKDIELSPRTVLAIATTVYFSAKWDAEFSEKNNDQKVFHGKDGNQTVEFMNQQLQDVYYWSDDFSAIKRRFELGGSMYFILPDENVSTTDVLMSDAGMSFILGDRNGVQSQGIKINMSIPKFDISANTDLIGGLKNLGVTDVFDINKADFTPLTDMPEVFVSDADHAVRVMIDEEGCTAAAYTVIATVGTGAPPPDEVDFVLDRPFIFVITNDVGLPLFVGVVNNI